MGSVKVDALGSEHMVQNTLNFLGLGSDSADTGGGQGWNNFTETCERVALHLPRQLISQGQRPILSWCSEKEKAWIAVCHTVAVDEKKTWAFRTGDSSTFIKFLSKAYFE